MISEVFPIVLDDVAVTLQFQVFEQDGRMCCGIYKLQGKINLPPRAWLLTVRRELARIEQIAKAAGCVEMRMAGRRWAKIFPDFEPWIGAKNGLRKML